MAAADPTTGLSSAPRRRDAEDNRRRIIDVATDVLAEQPAASIDDIARAAGLVRRTVYGHFPSRDALIASMCDDAIAGLLEVMAAARARGVSPAASYARFIIGTWQMADRYRLRLIVGRSQLGVQGVARVMMPVNSQVAELVAGAQADGSFDDQLPPAVLAGVLQATTFALLDSLDAGRWDGDPYLAAHAGLVAAGMDRRKAQRLIARLRDHADA